MIQRPLTCDWWICVVRFLGPKVNLIFVLGLEAKMKLSVYVKYWYLTWYVWEKAVTVNTVNCYKVLWQWAGMTLGVLGVIFGRRISWSYKFHIGQCQLCQVRFISTIKISCFGHSVAKHKPNRCTVSATIKWGVWGVGEKKTAIQSLI